VSELARAAFPAGRRRGLRGDGGLVGSVERAGERHEFRYERVAS
jgi:hypothetical protein